MVKPTAVADVCAMNLRRGTDFPDVLRGSSDLLMTVPLLLDGGTLHRIEPVEYRKSRRGVQEDCLRARKETEPVANDIGDLGASSSKKGVRNEFLCIGGKCGFEAATPGNAELRVDVDDANASFNRADKIIVGGP